MSILLSSAFRPPCSQAFCTTYSRGASGALPSSPPHLHTNPEPACTSPVHCVSSRTHPHTRTHTHGAHHPLSAGAVVLDVQEHPSGDGYAAAELAQGALGAAALPAPHALQRRGGLPGGVRHEGPGQGGLRVGGAGTDGQQEREQRPVSHLAPACGSHPALSGSPLLRAQQSRLCAARRRPPCSTCPRPPCPSSAGHQAARHAAASPAAPRDP